MLREDNADLRLMEIGNTLGLISDDLVKDVKERARRIEMEIKRIKGVIVRPTEKVNDYLVSQGTKPINKGVSLDKILKRTELDYSVIEALNRSPENVDKRVAGQVEIEIKYEGYIQKQLREIEKFKNNEKIKIPENFDFACVHGLSKELKEKLSSIKPTSLGQASRVDGMTPAALSVLMIAIKAYGK